MIFSITLEIVGRREFGLYFLSSLVYTFYVARDHGCHITKTVVEGYVEVRRRHGRPRKQYIDNIK